MTETIDELTRLIAHYRAGLDAELNLLEQLSETSDAQSAATAAGDYLAFEQISDERDRIMRGLVMIEAGLRGVRGTLAENRDRAILIDGYTEVVTLHQEAARLVATILSTDRSSLAALAGAELARRSMVASLERGERTLAAYRRVLTPPVEQAALVDRRG